MNSAAVFELQTLQHYFWPSSPACGDCVRPESGICHACNVCEMVVLLTGIGVLGGNHFCRPALLFTQRGVYWSFIHSYCEYY
jgi:hypothetical protein